MAIRVKAYKYDGDNRVINKQMATQATTIECRITDPQDIMNPELILEKINDINTLNYFTIGNRKYFKTGLVEMNNKMVKIRLHQDVLSTWMPFVNIKGKILNATKITNEYIDLGIPLEIYTKIVRVPIHSKYEELRSDPAIILQSPLPTTSDPNQQSANQGGN